MLISARMSEPVKIVRAAEVVSFSVFYRSEGICVSLPVEAEIPFVSPGHPFYGLSRAEYIWRGQPGYSGKRVSSCQSGACKAKAQSLKGQILLGAVKASTLDAAGMGVEMEGGKPGWYDALNGLPGLFGSSMCESCELKRLLDFTIQRRPAAPGGRGRRDGRAQSPLGCHE